jgi:phospholipase/lecithinase/hemolysin
MKTHLAQFNTILADHIASFKAANADATVLTFDSNAWFNMVLDSPAQFGFTNTTGFVPTLNITGFRIDHVYLGSAHVLTLQGSSGSVSAFCGVHTVSHIYVYSDSGHPTERVHRLLASAIETELRNSTFANRPNTISRLGTI